MKFYGYNFKITDDENDEIKLYKKTALLQKRLVKS